MAILEASQSPIILPTLAMLALNHVLETIGGEFCCLSVTRIRCKGVPELCSSTESRISITLARNWIIILRRYSVDIHGNDITFELFPKTTMPRLMWRGEGGLTREPVVSSPEEKYEDKKVGLGGILKQLLPIMTRLPAYTEAREATQLGHEDTGELGRWVEFLLGLMVMSNEMLVGKVEGRVRMAMRGEVRRRAASQAHCSFAPLNLCQSS